MIENNKQNKFPSLKQDKIFSENLKIDFYKT